MKQQLEQLLKDAEEVTAKMREALAQMDKPAPWMPKKGDWAEVIDGTFCFKTGDVIQIDEDGSLIPFCISQNGERRAISSHKLRHLPDYKPKPALAATYEEVVDVVKPKWYCMYDLDLIEYEYYDKGQLPTEAAAKQDAAFRQIKNLEAYCAVRFDVEREYSVTVLNNGKLVIEKCMYGFIRVSSKAAEWLIANHPEPFLVFFGVKS